MEIYVNLIPLSHLGGIDVSITPQDFLSEIPDNIPENDVKTIENSEMTVNNKDKDEINTLVDNLKLKMTLPLIAFCATPKTKTEIIERFGQ